MRLHSILLDCTAALDTGLHDSASGSISHLTPFLQLLGLLDVDSVLISNPRALLALPLLLRALPHAVQGPIYATSAALLIAQQLVAEVCSAAAAAAHLARRQAARAASAPSPGE
ncbi:MAG: hypothetical protein WDW36_008648 [Sanguina aurantia]